MEQRAQLTQNEVQWYKYLNYTARAYLHGWPGVIPTTKSTDMLRTWTRRVKESTRVDGQILC